MNDIAKSSLAVTMFTAISMGLGFLSNIIIAAKFGAGRDMDIYLAATTLPLFIVSIFSGALNFAFIPVFAEYRARDVNELWKLVSSLINLACIATALLCVVGMLLASPIMKAVAPGFTHEKLVQTAGLLRWLLPLVTFTVVNELIASVYYSKQRFLVPSVNKIINPLFIMGYVLAFHDFLSTKSIVLAMLTAAAVQTALLAFSFVRALDFHYFFVVDYRHPGVLKVLKLMTPLALGMIVYRAGPVVDRFFLSRLSEGSISHIGYAMQFMNALPPLIVSGISVSLFPVMSKYAVEKNWIALSDIMARGVRMVFFLSIPLLVMISIYGKPVIQLFFERGAFSPADTSLVYRALAIYLLALPAGVIGSIVSQGFYALQQNVLIALIGIGMMLLYVILCVLFISSWAYLAVPIAYAVYHNCAVLTTSNVLKGKLGGMACLPRLPFFLKSIAAALISAFLVYPAFAYTKGAVLLANILCGAGFLLYVFISKALFHLEEPKVIWETISIRPQRKPA